MTKRDWLITIVFALLHTATAIVCRIFGVNDELTLTLLTMILVVLLSIEKKTDTGFIAFAILVVNIAGALLGKGGAYLLGRLIASPIIVASICTFVSTIILGCGTSLLSNAYERRHAKDLKEPGNFGALLLVFVLIVVVRFVILLVTDKDGQTGNMGVAFIFDYLLTCIAVIYLTQIATRSSKQAAREQEKAHIAQYNYIKLKQNVDPHFLFNSLNVLDCMIQDGDNAAASIYVHKLADLYRSMIHNESEATISLRDEMDFASLYVDLLKVRFQNGFQVVWQVREQDLTRRVIPSSLQLLIENAIKHNAVSASRPLVVTIASDGQSVTVSNPIIPKVSSSPTESTGLGMKYLSQQYLDIAHEQIRVDPGEDQYYVSLPLI